MIIVLPSTIIGIVALFRFDSVISSYWFGLYRDTTELTTIPVSSTGFYKKMTSQ